MKTAKDYIDSMMWNGSNTVCEKLDWVLKEHDKEIIELIGEMISPLRKIQLDFEAQTSYFKNLGGWRNAENQIKLLTELKNRLEKK